MDNERFVAAINEMAREAHKNAVEHGFYEIVPSVPERLMLMVSELSEALEEFRDRNPAQYVVREESMCPQIESNKRMIVSTSDWRPGEKPEGYGVELADCIIRILDTCAHLGIDIGKLIVKKHEYNKTRPYKHGGKII